MNPVLHRTAQPISPLEFYDALRAAAPPRFPHARSVFPRRVALAVSGGVDSMALAYLCSRLRHASATVRVSDAPVNSFMALIVDHGLRAGSADEAVQVAAAVRQMGHRAQVWPLRWPAPGRGGRAGAGPGALETNARRLRYRLLADRMVRLKMVSLLLAHHEDDQYETIVMRLLSGYGLHGGIRGLRGMRPAIDIPECYDMHGAYQSGFLDDQRTTLPYVLLQPSRRERRRIKSALRDDMDPAVLAGEMEDGGGGDDLDGGGDEGGGAVAAAAAAAGAHLPYPPLPPLDTEDLGIMVYRPLLPFAKDRLVATCRANNVPWFEDPTNHDPALTLRNAVRRLAARHAPALPRALQKPAVLRLAARCDAAASQHDAEARRLVARYRIVARFTSNAGTVVARLPRLRPRARPRRSTGTTAAGRAYAAAARQRRRTHLRTVAALVVQTLLRLVTPEPHVSSVTQLQAVVDTLFPDLASPPPRPSPAPSPPKAFSICGVHFVPLPRKNKTTTGPDPLPARTRPFSPTTTTWFLSRAPYPSSSNSSTTSASHSNDNSNNTVSPSLDLPALTFALRWDKPPASWPWSAWSQWRLYDGRFWVRIRSRLPDKVVLRPFDAEHSKGFRAALDGGGGGPPGTPAGSAAAEAKPPNTAAALAATLKQYAPGKVRYTLPALYALGDRLPWERLAAGAYWPAAAALAGETAAAAAPDAPDANTLRLARFLWERAEHGRAREAAAAPAAGPPPPQVPPPQPLRLLALPTLGVHVPGAEHWLQWEVRYRKVDTALLESSAAEPLGWVM